jgi:hypothetical protein
VLAELGPSKPPLDSARIAPPHPANVAGAVSKQEGEELTVASPGLACELAQDLELAVTDWRPTAKYFREYGLEELRAEAGRVGVELPAEASREEAIEALLESERIGEYSPPELFFRREEVSR